MFRYTGNAYDRKFLPRLTTVEVASLPKDGTLLVLPVGAVEQHGAHLPVFTDTLLGEAMLYEAFERLPEEAPVWLLPSVSYGKSGEHLGHAGTITLSAQTMMALLLDIASSLQRSGFRKLVLFNTHGGNVDVLNMMARDIRIATGLAVFRLDPGTLQLSEGLVTDEEQRCGIHGGDVETSLVMAIQRHWVQAGHAVKEIPEFPETKAMSLRQKSFAWTTNDISSSGIAGDATAATEEKGRELLRRAGAVIAESLLEMAAFEMTSIKREGVMR
ncbi:creatininase family protein [Paenibacillus turpanensis]|uniref:creatininase family protein n=1 Tax=Paenibacillus turpanensis TaxID=2689078 RepID=UPI00140E3204|nr:creatininase family protein [Paenibacillus turpanensis]